MLSSFGDATDAMMMRSSGFWIELKKKKKKQHTLNLVCTFIYSTTGTQG
jgi:hypothetical protein